MAEAARDQSGNKLRAQCLPAIHPKISNYQRFMTSTFSSRQKLAAIADRRNPSDTDRVTTSGIRQKCQNGQMTSTPKKPRDNGDHSERCSSPVAGPSVFYNNTYHHEVTPICNVSQPQQTNQAVTTTNTPIISTQFRNARDFIINGNTTVTNIGVNTGVNHVTTVNNNSGLHGLEKVQNFVSFDALRNSSAQDPRRQCHPGTRRNVLKRMQDWIEDPNTPQRILWLYGPAGAGKSAIAQTITRSCASDVMATFFFYRSDPNRNDGNRLFITIAWQLAFSIPGFKDYIVHSLDQCPHLPTSDIETQFDQFVASPSMQILKEVIAQHSAPVVLIDGIDECIDEKLQMRFLNVIGNAVRDRPIPIRFLISSRPEAHIEDTISSFQPILRIDLAKLDDANRDIEKYLVDQFSRIASKQGLGLAWPGKKKIQAIVYKSSGNFIYASTIIRFVGDEDNIATRQLDIVLNLKPIRTTSPFASLDHLYLEILMRYPDQDFLKTFLALLVVHTSIRTDRCIQFHWDYATLMNVSVKELHIKLRRMRSLLKFESKIDVHHRSFIDFLQEPSRSGQYFVGEQGGRKRYVELIVDSIVRYISQVTERPNYHESPCFSPQFTWLTRDFPRSIVLPLEQWEKALRPLLQAQDKLLQLPNFSPTWNPLPFYKPTVFDAMRDLLLHFALLRAIPGTAAAGAVALAGSEIPGRCNNDISSTPTGTERNVLETDSCAWLSPLLSLLPSMESISSTNTEIMDLMPSLLCFDYVEIMMRIRSVSDAQRLIDHLVHLIDQKKNHHKRTGDLLRKLALEIFNRVPVLPQSLFLNKINRTYHNSWIFKERHFPTLCQTALVGRIMDHNYIIPVSEILEEGEELIFISDDLNQSYELIMKWRRSSNPSPITIMQIVLGVARAIQYLHSMNIVLHFGFSVDDVFLYPGLHPKIRYLGAASSTLHRTSAKGVVCYNNNIFSFGHILYEIYFGVKSHDNFCMQEMDQSTGYPYDPKITMYVRKLIQHCCAIDPKSRPTMDEIVEKIESYR